MDLSSPKIMAILNITDDSFYDGGRFYNEKSISTQAEKLMNEGADIIDIGGYSSRPGAKDIPLHEEIDRVAKGIKAVRKVSADIPISVDTFRSGVAIKAIESGAALINDISGGGLDKNMFQTIASNNVSYILMHMQGNPQNMMNNASYADLIDEILNYFIKKLAKLTHFGVKDVIIDVGFGFSKTAHQNFNLLHHLDKFFVLNSPLMVGISRKSMIYKTLNSTPEDALNGTSALHAIAMLKGANIFRVHDVKEIKEVINLVSLIKQ